MMTSISNASQLQAASSSNGNSSYSQNTWTYVIEHFNSSHNGSYTCVVSKDNVTSPESNVISLTSSFLCRCACPRTDAEFRQEVAALQKRLSVDRDGLSATTRRKTSASDDRDSSVAGGVVAAATVCVLVGLVVLSDMGRLLAGVFHGIDKNVDRTAKEEQLGRTESRRKKWSSRKEGEKYRD